MPADSRSAPPPRAGMLPVFKIIIAGPLGVGKTTLVRSVSEIEPVSTEAALTQASEHTDSVAFTPDKDTTTVAMDFGRRTFDTVALYLFGTPGQQRFWFLWDGLFAKAAGVMILADTRRLDDCFEAIDYVEQLRLPFVLAVNQFPDAPHYTSNALRQAADLDDDVPVVNLDARSRASSTDALIELMQHVRKRLQRIAVAR